MAREMKDSGIAWIGEIPREWNIGRLEWCLEEIKEKNDPIRTTNVLSWIYEYKIAQNDHFTIKDTDGQYYLNFLNFVQYCGQDGDDNFTTIAEESYHELLSTIRSSDGTYAEKPYQKLQWYKNYLKMWYLKNHPNERPLQLEDPPQ